VRRHAEIGERAFRVFIITLCLWIFQIVFATITGSISLWSDTVHVFSDLIAIGLVVGSQRLAQRSHRKEYTHTEDYHRVELYATMINGILLVAGGLILFTVATGRLFNPPEVSALILIPGIVGLTVNLSMVWLLLGDRQHLTVKSAIAHVSLDSLASVGVIVAGVLIFAIGAKLIDPIVSFFIIALMVFWGVRLIRLARTTQIRQRNNTAT